MTIDEFYKRNSAMGKLAIQEKKARGEIMHKAPLGYLNGRDELGRSILIPDPERYELVQEARALYSTGMSVRQVLMIATDKGLRSRKGKPLLPMALWRVLRISNQCETT